MSYDEELPEPEVDDMDMVYRKVPCPWCLSTPEWECYLVAGKSGKETPICPNCDHKLPQFRADLGSTLTGKGAFKCTGFVPAKEFSGVTFDLPLLCQWCNWFMEEKICKHPDDPKRFAIDPTRRPNWWVTSEKEEKKK